MSPLLALSLIWLTDVERFAEINYFTLKAMVSLFFTAVVAVQTAGSLIEGA